MVAPLRPILRLTDGGIVTQLYRALGGAPKPLVRRAFQLSSGTKLITKPLAMLQHLDDAEWLAQIEAVDRFTANMIAYPGRTFGQLYHRMLKHNQLLSGKVNLSGHEIDMAAIKQPVLVFAGNTDGIAPINAVRALIGLLLNAHEVRFEIVPGGHLGMLTGRAARGTTWPTMDEWIEQYSTPDDRAVRAKARSAAKKTAKRAPAKKAARRRSPGRVGHGGAPAGPRPPTARRSAPTPSAASPRVLDATSRASREGRSRLPLRFPGPRPPAGAALVAAALRAVVLVLSSLGSDGRAVPAYHHYVALGDSFTRRRSCR